MENKELALELTRIFYDDREGEVDNIEKTFNTYKEFYESLEKWDFGYTSDAK